MYLTSRVCGGQALCIVLWSAVMQGLFLFLNGNGLNLRGTEERNRSLAALGFGVAHNCLIKGLAFVNDLKSQCFPACPGVGLFGDFAFGLGGDLDLGVVPRHPQGCCKGLNSLAEQYR